MTSDAHIFTHPRDECDQAERADIMYYAYIYRGAGNAFGARADTPAGAAPGLLIASLASYYMSRLL